MARTKCTARRYLPPCGMAPRLHPHIEDKDATDKKEENKSVEKLDSKNNETENAKNQKSPNPVKKNAKRKAIRKAIRKTKKVKRSK